MRYIGNPVVKPLKSSNPAYLNCSAYQIESYRYGRMPNNICKLIFYLLLSLIDPPPENSGPKLSKTRGTLSQSLFLVTSRRRISLYAEGGRLQIKVPKKVVANIQYTHLGTISVTPRCSYTVRKPFSWIQWNPGFGSRAPPCRRGLRQIFGSGPEPYGVPPAIAVDPPGINTCCRVAGPAREGSGADSKICSSPRH